MNSIALPKIKSKRKRKKPMPPWLIYRLLWLVFSLTLLGLSTINISTQGATVTNVLLFTFWIMMSVWDYYLFKMVWDKWRKDNDDE